MRIGCVPYLNAKPLIEGLPGVILRPPAELARLLAARKLDAALVPVAAVLEEDWEVVPGIAIASPGRTDSVRLYHAVEVPRVTRVALDRNSRTSNLLARIILERRYGLRPGYVLRDPVRGLTFKGFDAAVTIGDTSFLPRGRPYLDLGSEWKALTGKPFVYAVWAHRKGHPRAREIARLLRQAKRRGVRSIGGIASRESGRLGLTERYCRRYLTKCITFDLGP
ncbi:MAG TPA: menaquinone biosynthesis protein, partial [Planctomycetota bacterium]|nr:menaquinone biosynthesis protein [Planctomycetota bacterium]